jgi:flagellar assembly factor FliW
MRVATDRFGEIDVPEDRILHFGDGLPGFAHARNFTMVEVEGAKDFFWLQSLDDSSLAFLAAVPWPFFPDYEPEVPEADQEALGLEQAEDAMVLCLLTVHREQETVTANLLGPVIVNQRTRLGRQVVLADSNWPVRAPLAAA